MVSVIIPTFNESRIIARCLQSLQIQSVKDLEIIVVDDGSTDSTLSTIRNLKFEIRNIILLKQKHQGPGVARNLAAKKAWGDILVFVDADMTFATDFVEKVVAPIKAGRAIGTDSQDGTLANPENFWARCWNMGKFAAAGNYSADYLTEITPNKRDHGGVFRAISKKEFIKAGGFDIDGDYTDDTSLSRKLKEKASVVRARFYHANPDTLSEVWLRASWIGAGKNFTQAKYFNLIKFFPVLAVVKGIIIGWRFNNLSFLFFKIIYDTAVWLSIIKSL